MVSAALVELPLTCISGLDLLLPSDFSLAASEDFSSSFSAALLAVFDPDDKERCGAPENTNLIMLFSDFEKTELATN